MLICAGGTGGGVYPALSVHNALKAAWPETQILWVGGEGGMEAGLVKRAGIAFKAIPAAGIHGISLKQMPANLISIARGIRSARAILNEFQPDVMFFTGGYVAVPMAVAGRNIPSVLYVPDIEPGLALKALANFAGCITVTSEQSKQFFSGRKNIVVTGYPLREELLCWNKDSARKHFNISGDRPVLLVFGGSKGARSLNMALLAHLDVMLERMEIIHITGELDWPQVMEKSSNLPAHKATYYHSFPYLHEDMGAAVAAADVALSRAGASVLGEFPHFGTPAILVPYPYAWRYQKVNADVLVSAGAALMIEDARLMDALLPAVENLFDHPNILESMHSAMESLRTPNAAHAIAEKVSEMAGARSL